MIIYQYTYLPTLEFLFHSGQNEQDVSQIKDK